MEDSKPQGDRWVEGDVRTFEPATVTDLQGCDILEGTVDFEASGVIYLLCSNPPPDVASEVFLNVEDDRIRITDFRLEGGVDDAHFVGKIVTDE